MSGFWLLAIAGIAGYVLYEVEKLEPKKSESTKSKPKHSVKKEKVEAHKACQRKLDEINKERAELKKQKAELEKQKIELEKQIDSVIEIVKEVEKSSK